MSHTTFPRLLAAAAAGLLLLTACSSASASDSADAATDAATDTPAGTSEMIVTEDLDIAGSWVLVDNDAITLTVESDGHASGKSACNNYMSTINRDPATDALVVGPAASTMMMCDDAAMAAETAYLTAFQAVVAGEIVDGQLVLTTVDGETLVFDAAA